MGGRGEQEKGREKGRGRRMKGGRGLNTAEKILVGFISAFVTVEAKTLRKSAKLISRHTRELHGRYPPHVSSTHSMSPTV